MKCQVPARWGERAVRIQGKFFRVVGQLWAQRNYRRKLIGFPCSLIAIFLIFSWAAQTNSCAFHAFFAIILFDVITLLGDLLSQAWLISGKPSTSFSFGYVRVEVLTHFSILCLGLLLNCWAIKKSLELVLIGEQSDQEIHTGRFIPGAVLGGVLHFFLSFNNNPFLKVYKVSATTTTLQKYFQGICASFGLSLSSTSAFSLSPFAILGACACSVILVLAFALQTGSQWFDFVGGIIIILAFFDAIWPLTVYTAQVLLQTVPAHVVTQLEKSLREALTIDGVLEFRNELFWTLTYGQIAGTLHVRVSRDANEQLVLSKVFDKLQPLAPHLTIQITKDDFGRPFGHLHLLRDLDSSLSHVTVGHSHSHSSDLSPIPVTGHNHLNFTTTRSGSPIYNSPGIGVSSTPRYSHSNDYSLYSVHIPSRNDFSPKAELIKMPIPTTINNHFSVPSRAFTTTGHGHPTNITSNFNGASSSTNMNLLISSANNHHPE